MSWFQGKSPRQKAALAALGLAALAAIVGLPLGLNRNRAVSSAAMIPLQPKGGVGDLPSPTVDGEGISSPTVGGTETSSPDPCPERRVLLVENSLKGTELSRPPTSGKLSRTLRRKRVIRQARRNLRADVKEPKDDGVSELLE